MTRSNPESKAMFQNCGGNASTGKANCPACGSKMSVDDGEKRPVVAKCWNPNGGCSHIEIMSAYDQKYKVPASRLPKQADNQNQSTSAKRPKRDTKKLALEIINEAESDPQRLKKYFTARGISKFPSHLLYLPKAEAKSLGVGFFEKGSRSKKYFDLLVAHITDENEVIQGCQVTPIKKPDGGRATFKSGEPVPRRTYGRMKYSRIELGEAKPNRRLILAEGLESALAASQISGIKAAFATCGAGNLPEQKIPDCKEVVIVADIDKDGAGVRAAENAASLYRKQGHRVRVVKPPVPKGEKKWDANDLLRSGHKRRIQKFRELLRGESSPPVEQGEFFAKSMAEVEAQPLNWFWEPFLVGGAVNSIFGDGGSGKSSVCVDLAARITQGRAMPLSGSKPAKGSILYLSKEEDVASVLMGRLEAAGADLKKCHFMTRRGHDEDFATLDNITGENLDRLREAVRRIGDVKLIVIDPINSFAGRADIYKDTDVRGLLIDPLSKLAQQFGLTVILIMHLNKSREGSARNRALGSGAFINAVRGSCLVALDRQIAGSSHLVKAKLNYTKQGNQSIGFMHKPQRAFTQLVWDEELGEKDPNELLAFKKTEPKRKKFEEELVKFLKDKGGQVSAKRMEKFIAGSMVSERTAKTVKKVAGIVSKKRNGKWYWRLPE